MISEEKTAMVYIYAAVGLTIGFDFVHTSIDFSKMKA